MRFPFLKRFILRKANLIFNSFPIKNLMRKLCTNAKKVYAKYPFVLDSKSTVLSALLTNLSAKGINNEV